VAFPKAVKSKSPSSRNLEHSTRRILSVIKLKKVRIDKRNELGASFFVWNAQTYLVIEPSCSPECWIKRVRSIRSSYDNDRLVVGLIP
jgi:hypothetical protein